MSLRPAFLSRRRLVVGALLGSVILAGCGGKGSSANAPTGGITVTPGDTQVTITWQQDAGVEYWLWYAPGSTINPSDSNTPGIRYHINIGSPYVVTGLTNGTQYAFALNGRINGGKGGDYAYGTTTPRLAGTTWTAVTNLTADMRGLAYGTTSTVTTATYVAAGTAGAAFSSTDGHTWIALANPAGTANVNAMTVGLSTFIAVGDGGAIYYSTDLSTWTQATSNTTNKLTAVATSGGVAVAVGENGTIRYSTSAGTWTAAASVPSGIGHLYGISYTPSGLWIAVGAGGVVLTSSDGTNWTQRTSGTAATLYGVSGMATTSGSTTTYTYVATGAGGQVLTSSDGTTWTASTVSPAVTLYSVIGSNQFVAVGANGAAFTSPDGVTWTYYAASSGNDLYTLMKAANQYIAVGANKAMAYSK